MSDQDKTKQELIEELNQARKLIAEFRKQQDKQALFSAIIETTLDLVSMSTPDGQITYLNPAGRGMLGWEDIEGKNIADAHPEWALEQLRETAAPTLGRTDAWFGESTVVNVEGAEIPVSQVITAHRSPTGELEAYSTVIRDISDQRATEEAITRTVAFLQSCVLSIPDAVLLLDEKGRFMSVNPLFLSWVERELEDFVGKTLREVHPPFLPPETTEVLAQRVEERLRKGDSVSEVEFSVTDPSGKARSFLYSAAAVLGENEEVLGEIVIIRDISKLRQFELELRESEEKFRMLSEQSQIAISIIQDGRVVYLNDQSSKITEYTKEEILAWGPDEFKKHIHPEDIPALFDSVKRIRGNAAAKHMTFRMVSRSGKIKWVDQYTKAITWAGQPALFNASLDITERKHLQEMMVQSEKMLSVGGLAAGMAHEINNPLAGILQAIQVIRTRLSSEIRANRVAADKYRIDMEAMLEYLKDRKVMSMIGSIQEAGAQAASIVENMLSISRKSDSVISKNSLGELLDKTVELTSSDYDLKKKYDFRQIVIVREYEEDMPLVACQKSEIQQVFLNILRNAAEAMSESNTLQDPSQFILRVQRHGDRARVEIEDNGPGMSEESRKRVFEPFYTTKKVGEGTGLGLSVSYFIITDHHGGTMGVESTLGAGTKFIIELPISP